MKIWLIILLICGWLLTIFSISSISPYIQENPVIKTIYNNKIIVNGLVEEELKNIFEEIEKTGYKINDVKCFRPYSGSFSWHNYGLAVDINYPQNPCLGTGCIDELSRNFKGQWIAGKNGALTKEVVEIFKKYGWCWGGDWCGKKDYMHFSKPIGLKEYDECQIAKCYYFKSL